MSDTITIELSEYRLLSESAYGVQVEMDQGEWARYCALIEELLDLHDKISEAYVAACALKRARERASEPTQGQASRRQPA
jgi:hypothetical protein